MLILKKSLYFNKIALFLWFLLYDACYEQGRLFWLKGNLVSLKFYLAKKKSFSFNWDAENMLWIAVTSINWRWGITGHQTGLRKSRGLVSLKMLEKHIKNTNTITETWLHFGSNNFNEKFCYNYLQLWVFSKQQMCEVLNSMWEKLTFFVFKEFSVLS